MLIQQNGLKGAALWVEDPKEGAGPYRTNDAHVVTKKKKKKEKPRGGG